MARKKSEVQKSSVLVTARVDEDVKLQAEKILDKLGITIPTFINISLRQVLIHKGIPFDLVVPDEVIADDNLEEDIEEQN
ncbi:MAG: type II toxin-antitoxin system RelB/DinJ family antitoxin [Eubacteriales bacterium]|nr:type II toxin-antitoxin system RelB/DinJ family antitoxin [Eubacteriales bacterium]